MKESSTEKLLARILGFAASFTTIFVISGSVTDPVNVSKFLSLGVFSCASIAIVLNSNLRLKLGESKIVILFLFSFMIFAIFSAFSSKSPLSQLIYGVYGRNNGLLMYLFLSLIFVSALSIRGNYRHLIQGLIVAGSVNVIYCLWVVAFGDFIGWSNPYGNILGTLGNPNFIGSFLGIFFATCLSISLDSKNSKRVRYFVLVLLPIIAFEIVKSHAIQGRVVAGLGTAVVGFLFIRTRVNKIVLVVYCGLTAIVGTLSLLGALQIGPMTSFIYKTSVSLRGQYWLAGWNTGTTHPFTGAGMDSFGDWYRRTRDAHALILPGPNVVVNASHNVFLDMLAFGGWPLFLSYILITGASLIAVIKLVSRVRVFDSTMAILVSAWLGYQVQSVISINQIGLAIWGWMLGGALIAFEISSRNMIPVEEPQKKKSSTATGNPPKLVLTGALGALIGLILSLPPILSDAKWRSAQVARNLPNIEASMVASYFNPQNTTKFLSNIQAMEASGLFDLSHKYALQAVSWNPDAYDLWKVLYFIKNSTPQDKSIALSNMKRLDPLNPDVTSTQ